MINLILGDCLQKLRELPARIDTEFGSAWLDKDNHYYISVKRKGKWTTLPLHKALYLKHVGEVPSGYDIHHVNHIPTDNRLENLVCITKQEHRRIHAGWVKFGGEFDHKAFYKWAREAKFPVFISEYNMPDDFFLIASTPKKQKLCASKTRKEFIEKIFTNKIGYDLFHSQVKTNHLKQMEMPL